MWRLSIAPQAIGLALLLAFPAAGSAEAGEIGLFGVGGNYSVRITSIREARFRKIVKQQLDFSCGSAAVATLLRYHYETPIKEADALVAMYKVGDQKLIQEKGFSLLDMKGYLKARGFAANGYRGTLDKLATVGIPAIALINFRGYLHFVVIKGVRGDRVLVGDPALGMKTYSREAFDEMWNGILFVVEGKINVAQKYFNDERDWLVRHKAPFGTALNRQGLASFTMQLPRSNEVNF